jgi:hypothetical protein
VAQKPRTQRSAPVRTLLIGPSLTRSLRSFRQPLSEIDLAPEDHGRQAGETRSRAFERDGNAYSQEAEQDLMETLVYGSAEHFFDTQMGGMATRFLGSRFRLDDGSSADYSGPYYDVYKVADQIKTSPDEREQLKLYYFNSETLLLERVTYEINRNGSTVKVEERLGDWTKEQGQEDGGLKMVLCEVPRRSTAF